MSKGFKIKKEEYTTVGDFIKPSFVRDQPVIMSRYPKFNSQFLADFESKLLILQAPSLYIMISGFFLLPSSYYVCVFGGALLESCTGGLVYR